MPEKLKDKDVLVIYIDDNGLCKILNHSVEKVGADGYIKFTTTHFSTFAVVDKDEAEQLIQKQNAAHVKELMQTGQVQSDHHQDEQEVRQGTGHRKDAARP